MPNWAAIPPMLGVVSIAALKSLGKAQGGVLEMAKRSTFRRTNGSLLPPPISQSAHPATLMTSPWYLPSLIMIQSVGKLILLRKSSSPLKRTPFLAFPFATPFRMTSLFGWGTQRRFSWLGALIMWPSHWLRQAMRVNLQLVTPGLYYRRGCGISTFLRRLEFLLGGLV